MQLLSPLKKMVQNKVMIKLHKKRLNLKHQMVKLRKQQKKKWLQLLLRLVLFIRATKTERWSKNLKLPKNRHLLKPVNLMLQVKMLLDPFNFTKQSSHFIFLINMLYIYSFSYNFQNKYIYISCIHMKFQICSKWWKMIFLTKFSLKKRIHLN